MHDVELLLCAHAVDPALPPLLAQVANWEVSRDIRQPAGRELRAIAAAELAMARDRWTPFYDRALHAIAGASDDVLFEPAWVYAPSKNDRGHYDDVWLPDFQLGPARSSLETHARLCEQLLIAEQQGARTLARAFELLAVERDELTIWFRLCPDPAALDCRLRDAALAYLEATCDRCPDPELEAALLEQPGAHVLRMRYHAVACPERSSAMGILLAVSPSERSFAATPPELLGYLGNPFDPRI